jgi:K+-sensing histidine kinase KdpD
VSASGEPGAGDELRALVHDLRTPLTIVQGFSDLLVRRGDELEPEQRAEYAQRIADAARELRELIDRASSLPSR